MYICVLVLRVCTWIALNASASLQGVTPAGNIFLPEGRAHIFRRESAVRPSSRNQRSLPLAVELRGLSPWGSFPLPPHVAVDCRCYGNGVRSPPCTPRQTWCGHSPPQRARVCVFGTESDSVFFFSDVCPIVRTRDSENQRKKKKHVLKYGIIRVRSHVETDLFNLGFTR